MNCLKPKRLIGTLILLFSLGCAIEFTAGEDALARAGGRRSFGQRSQPTSPQRSPAPQQQPNYGQGNYNQQQYGQPPVGQNRGGFMRGLAGGLAGGFLGSMLFSSLGNAAGLGGAGSGGFGLIEIILLGGLLYFGFRLWKSKQNNHARFATAQSGKASPSVWHDGPSVGHVNAGRETGYFSDLNKTPTPGQLAAIDRETAEDIFFKVQGAFTRRDLSSAADCLSPAVASTLTDDITELKKQHLINRLENISVRSVDIGETWIEGESNFVNVRFTANLLDYTVDESSGAIKDGSASIPVKFEENWIFVKPKTHGSWLLAGIEQV